ncbi:phospho-N-acetylmuramoyl-pentapeptide-transferase [Oceanirhabdus sp. W0125-5]|uniref:phospho-N-acetylmuramoyl-pentapeptide- transferase n=1 Tax=Oceanirhabdus sp. W0125-5 TaxID=2999116 RepID=UPI0022F30D2D|nr:phospho-N-acetylmuramoyl-pentapeptide-transferase [Oceanirhabdus sp. W0125-5]WBW95538.1 phospho-N-acetylmuramoyl-pentapeptide-transferase [Oceanirhabdus sp. W0125-5]
MKGITIYLTTILCTVVGLNYFIRLVNDNKILRRNKSSDIIKKSCIRELHKNKLNTPTMGGIVMNIIFFIMIIVYYLINKEILWFNIFIILFGVMGFIDDYIKIKKIRDGVTPKEKFIGLTLISLFYVIFLIFTKEFHSTVAVPFINKGIEVNIIMYCFFILVLLIGTTNSVNITDGLDGLMLGIGMIVLAFIALISWKVKNTGVLYSSLMVQATCIGALLFNKYPAKIFIGDTGSLFLGGAIGIFMIELNVPLWIIIVIAVCLWETITVIIQLSSLRLTGKRVFKIAPYHHHLEKCGWNETKIVHVFWTITLVLCIVGYLGI